MPDAFRETAEARRRHRKPRGVISLHHGDSREIIPTLGVTVDAVVTDPPYNLEAMAKRFGPGQKAATSPYHQRFAKGFMGMTWDSDVAFQPETWVTIGSVLRPGGFLVAFGGTRTYHRLAVAIEDAGFVIQDSILDLIASDARVQRFVATLSPAQVDAFSQVIDDLQPTGALAWAFATGFPKRRDNLKPAFEPIVLAYKPGGKRTLQVDECRIANPDADLSAIQNCRGRKTGLEFGSIGASGYSLPTHNPAGRWPANVCHDGSDEVVACFPESGNGSGKPVIAKRARNKGWCNASPGEGVDAIDNFGDGGSAARFFFSAKAGAQDRWGSRHPTVKPVELMKWLVALVTPPNGTCLDPFAGSGTTAVAALATGRNAILIERDDQYIADIRQRLAFYEGGGMHSIQAKNRNRMVDHGPLFAPPPLTAAELDSDATGSYDAAIRAIGERVKAGEPVPATGYFGRREASE